MVQLMSSLALYCRFNAFVSLTLGYLLFIVLGSVVFTVLEKPVEKELMAEVEELWHSFLQENPCVQASRLGKLLARVVSTHH